MARLDTFKNSDLKNKEAVIASMTAAGMTVEEDETVTPAFSFTAADKEPNKEPTLRHQMLRWYNANPDMLDVAIRNVIRLTEPYAAKGELFDYAKSYKTMSKCLTQHEENIDVNDITFLEDFLFCSYPMLVALAKHSRPDSYKPKHLVTEDIEAIDIYKLTNALVEASRKDDSPFKRYNYLDMLDILTC